MGGRMSNCKHPDLIVQRNYGHRWITCTVCLTDFMPLDFDTIWERYYTLEDRRFLPGLTYNELFEVVYGEKKV